MILLYLLGLYLGIGVVWFVIHAIRVRRNDLIRNTTVGDFRRWEWPLVFIITAMIWPYAFWYHIHSRPERA